MGTPEKLPVEPFINAVMKEALGAWGANLKEKKMVSLKAEIVDFVKGCLRKKDYEPLSDEAEEIARVTRAYVAGMFSRVSR